MRGRFSRSTAPPPANQTRHRDVRYFLSILGTDYIFTCPTAMAAAGIAARSPTYVYLFDHLNSYNKYMQHDWIPECDDFICHGSELPALFHTGTLARSLL